MIEPAFFFKELAKHSIDFFVGVPDSLLKSFLAFIADNAESDRNIITANEGAAIALAAGYHVATNKVPLVYMQNSGIGNAVNPLLSLADSEVYAIPMILLIGWRGEPGVKDEPQHIKQGRISPALLDSLEIPFLILDEDSDSQKLLQELVKLCKKNSKPVAILVRKGTFSDYDVRKVIPNRYSLTREEALAQVLKTIPPNSIVISSTGMLSRELFELREKYGHSHKTDFLTVGSMGHSSQIALGIAIAKADKNVYCFDGDGAALMHLGNYAIIGQIAPKNLKLILFNNGAHDSVGGQPTISHNINLSKTVESFGIYSFGAVKDISELEEVLPQLIASKNLSFLEIRINKGSRKDLGRPTKSPQENINILKAFLKE